MPTKQIPIDGVIGWDVSAADIRAALADAGPVELLISSPGGDVAEGLAIYNAIRDHRRAGHQVSARVVGLAASMATYIPLAAERITVEDNAVFMIHNAWGLAIGDYRDMRKTGDVLDGLTRTIARAYAERTGQEMNAIRQQMDDETWLFGQDIVDAGFADALEPAGDGPEDSAEALAIARARFDAMTAKLKERDQTPLDQIAALLPLHTPETQAMADTAKQDPAATPEQEPLTEPKTTPTEPVTEPQDPQALVQAAIAAERQRVAAITARCNQVGMAHLTQALIDSGAGMAACNAAIVDAYVAKGGAEIRQTTDALPHGKDESQAAAKIRDAYAKINAQITTATKRPE